jgi:hypothetical protein
MHTQLCPKLTPFPLADALLGLPAPATAQAHPPEPPVPASNTPSPGDASPAHAAAGTMALSSVSNTTPHHHTVSGGSSAGALAADVSSASANRLMERRGTRGPLRTRSATATPERDSTRRGSPLAVCASPPRASPSPGRTQDLAVIYGPGTQHSPDPTRKSPLSMHASEPLPSVPHPDSPSEQLYSSPNTFIDQLSLSASASASASPADHAHSKPSSGPGKSAAPSANASAMATPSAAGLDSKAAAHANGTHADSGTHKSAAISNAHGDSGTHKHATGTHARAEAGAHKRASKSSEPSLPPGWVTKTDKQTGRTYYAKCAAHAHGCACGRMDGLCVCLSSCFLSLLPPACVRLPLSAAIVPRSRHAVRLRARPPGSIRA